MQTLKLLPPEIKPNADLISYTQEEFLGDNNFVTYCCRHYDNVNCHDEAEFFADLNRIKYIKNLLTRAENSGNIKVNIILNNIIIMLNLFGPYHLPRILFLKFKGEMNKIKPFLVFLKISPIRISNVGIERSVVLFDEFDMDASIVEALRKI